MALDLAGSVPDAVDAGVAPDPLQRQLVHQAHPAQNLDRLVAHELQHLGGRQLGHGRIGVAHLAPRRQPRRPIRHQLGLQKAGAHVGELERNALEAPDAPAELPACGGPVQCQRQGPVGPAQAGGGNLQTGAAQPLVGHVEALVLLAEQVGGGDAGVVEVQDEVVIAPVRHAVVARQALHAGRVEVHQQRRDESARPAPGGGTGRGRGGTGHRFSAGGREQDHVVGKVGVAYEVLGAVHDEPVAAALGPTGHAPQVGARARLAHGQALNPLAPHGGQQVLVHLFPGAGPQDVRRAGHYVLQGIAGEAEGPLGQCQGQVVEPAAAQLLGHVGRVQPRGQSPVADLLHQVGPHLAGALHLFFVGDELALHERAHGVDHHFLRVVDREFQVSSAPSCERPPYVASPPGPAGEKSKSAVLLPANDQRCDRPRPRQTAGNCRQEASVASGPKRQASIGKRPQRRQVSASGCKR